MTREKLGFIIVLSLFLLFGLTAGWALAAPPVADPGVNYQ